jgi:CopG family nickel-responsive transcriptional regulator
MSELRRFGVSLPAKLLEAFDEYLEQEGYSTRSEALRDMMREHLIADQWVDPESSVVGVITLVYDHHTYRLEDHLTEEQHEHFHMVRCSTHVHMDEHNCVEVIVVEGKSAAVQELADRLIALRGVQHGTLSCTAVGAGE